MRNPGVDYVRLFQMHALVPLKTDEEYVESTTRLEWLGTRTDISESARDYEAVLRLVIKDYEDRRDDNWDQGHLPPLPNDPPVDDGESGEETTEFNFGIDERGDIEHLPSGTPKRKPGRPRKES